MYAEYEAETAPLFKLLRTEAFRFVLVRYSDRSLIEKLKEDLQDRFTDRPIQELDAANLDYRGLMDAYSALGKGFLLIGRFEELLKKPDLFNGLNLRRDKLAQSPIALIGLLSDGAGELWAREIMEKMPDLWSLRSFVMELRELVGSPDTNHNRIIDLPTLSETHRISTLGGRSSEEKREELARLLALIAETPATETALLRNWYRQVITIQEDLAAYQDALDTLEKARGLLVSNDAEEAEWHEEVASVRGLRRQAENSKETLEFALNCYEQLALQNPEMHLPEVGGIATELAFFYQKIYKNQPQSLAYAKEALKALKPFEHSNHRAQRYLQTCYEVLKEWGVDPQLFLSEISLENQSE